MANNTYTPELFIANTPEEQKAQNVMASHHQKLQQQAARTFNGVQYNTQEQAQAAKNKYLTLAKIDYLNAGGDMNVYKQQKANKSGLRDISDHEWNYISKLAKEDTSPTAYTKSATDQYLYSLGLPSSKDLTQYRAKYAKYTSGGGIIDNYSNLSNDELKYIQREFAKDYTKTINGDGYVDSKGNALQYEDNLLDAELLENQLPSAELMEQYHAKYLNHQEVESRINNLYKDAIAEVEKIDFSKAYEQPIDSFVNSDTATKHTIYNTAEGRKSTYEERFNNALQQALYDKLQLPVYADLAQYVSEKVALPSKTDEKYLSKEATNYGQFDPTSSYYADYQKALEKNAAREDAEFVISTEGLSNYYAKKKNDERNEALSKKYAKNAELISTQATTAEQKAAQEKALEEHVRVYGGSTAQYTWYINAINAGVPASVAIDGAASIEKWNNYNNASNPAKWAEVQSALLGYDPFEGETEHITSALTTQRVVTTRDNYASASLYNPALYQRQVKTDIDGDKVTTQGAIYAIVNGHKPAQVSDLESSKYGYLYQRIYSGIGTENLANLLTDDELGTFNALYESDTRKAMQYLDSVAWILEDRSAESTLGKLTKGITSDMTDEEMTEYLFDLQMYNEGRAIMSMDSDMTESWHKDAWRKYYGYSDEQLQYMLDSAYSDWYGIGEEALLNKRADGEQTIRDIEYVKGVRENALNKAQVAASQNGYSADEAAESTKAIRTSLEENGGTYVDASGKQAKYAGVVNNVMHEGWQHHPDIEAQDRFDRKEQAERDIADDMSESEVNHYNWLLDKKGAEAADAYYEYIRSEVDARSSQSVVEERKNWAKENPTIASALSNILFPATGVAAVGGTIANIVTGTELTRTQAARWDFTNEWREAVAETKSPGGAFFYQTFMSMLDSGAAAGMNMALPGLGEVALASTAFSGTLRSSLDRGLNPTAATATATVAGLAEYVTEKIGLENLVEGIKSLGSGVERSVIKEAIINTAKQAVYEGSEELASDVINLVADSIINGDVSEFNQNTDNYVRQGYDRKEAERLAWNDWIGEAALSTAGGFVSGGVMAGLGNAGGVAIRGLQVWGLGDERAAVGNQRHVNQFIEGSDVVSDLYGSKARWQMRNDLGAGETVGLSKKIDSVKAFISGDALEDADKSAYWYSLVYGNDGKLKLNDNERIALASALALNGADANSASIDKTLAESIAKTQNKSQREANTNSDFVMSTHSYNQVLHNIAQAKNELANLPKRVTEINTKIKDVQARLDGVRQKIANVRNQHQTLYSTGSKFTSVAEDLKTLQNRESTLQTELSNHINELNTLNVKGVVENNQSIIKTNQDLLDRHWASLAKLLDFTGNTASIYNEQFLSDAKAREKMVSQSIENNLNGNNEEEMGLLRKQLTQAKEDIEKGEKAKAENDSGLDAALVAAKQGNVKEWLAERQRTYAEGVLSQIQATQEQGRADAQSRAQTRASDNAQPQVRETTRDERTAQDEVPPLPDEATSESAPQSETLEQQTESAPQENASTEANSAPTSEVSNSTTEIASEENTASEDATEASKPVRKATYKISKQVQQKFERIANRFGCKIIWETRDKVQGNGYYDSEHPNEIHLATELIAKEGISSEQAVARAFFVHEITHYVANTRTYRTLANNAYEYYKELYGDEAVQKSLNRIIDEEARYGRQVDMAYAEEEMTARFAQEVLFDNNKSLNWLARKDVGAVSDFLTWVEYLIKRGSVRKMKNGSAVKTLLVDSEFALAKAIEERQYLDKANKTSAYMTSKQIKKQAQERAQAIIDSESASQEQAQETAESQPQADRTGALATAENEAEKYDRAVENGEMNEDGTEVVESEQLTEAEQAEEQAQLDEDQARQQAEWQAEEERSENQAEQNLQNNEAETAESTETQPQVTLPQNVKMQTRIVAQRLSAGTNVVMQIPTNELFHATSNLLQETVFDTIPEDKRDGVTFTSTINPTKIQQTLAEPGTHFIVTSDAVKKTGDNASWFKMNAPAVQNTSAQAVQRDLLTRTGAREERASGEDAYANTFGESGVRGYSRTGDEFAYEAYLTPEARERYSKDERYVHKNYKYPQLAFITAASWNNVDIPVDVLLQIPEIAEAQARIDAQGNQFFHEDYPVGTNEKVDAMRREWVAKLQDSEHGSAVFENGKIKKNSEGKGIYTGDVRQDKIACIVVGPPAAGKSSVFADPLSNQYKARIMDSDTVKEWIPGFNEGFGAGYVHEESADIMEKALRQVIRRGDNIVIPKLGGNSVLALAEYLKGFGYKVNLYLNNVSGETSATRAASRFGEEGRYLSLKMLSDPKTYLKGYDVFIKNAENKELFDYAEWRDNGEVPKRLVWKRGSGDLNEAIRRENERRNANLGQPVENRQVGSVGGRLAGSSLENEGRSGRLTQKGSTAKGASSLYTEPIASQVAARELNGYQVDKESPYFDMPYARQYNNWIAKGKNASTRFNLGELPRLYAQYAGAKYNTVLLDASKVTKEIQNNRAEHPHLEMTDDIVKRLPSVLEDPILIIGSETIPGRIVVVGDLAAHIDEYSDGRYADRYLPVMVVLELDAEKKGHKLGAAMVTSAYTKNKDSFAMQRVLNTAGQNGRVLWKSGDTQRTRSWESTYRLHLPSPSSNYGSSNSVSQNTAKSNTSNIRTQNTREDLKNIAANKTLKNITRRNSNSGEEFMPIDWSKNKLVNRSGEQYKKVYSGSKAAGFMVFDPLYADDGLSTFMSTDVEIAKSYTDKESKAPEFDPRIATSPEEQRTRKGNMWKWIPAYSVAESNDKLLDIVNDGQDGVFTRPTKGKPDFTWLGEVKSNLKEYISESDPKGDETHINLAKDGIMVADMIQYAASKLGTNHSVADYENMLDLYGELCDINEQLEVITQDIFLAQRALRQEEDYKVTSGFDIFEDYHEEQFLEIASYLKVLQTATQDRLIDSGIYQVLRDADALKQQNGVLTESPAIGITSKYKGKAVIVSGQEALNMMPTYREADEGYYVLRPYAENPLLLDTEEQNWDYIDPYVFPDEVYDKLVDLYGYKLGYKTREVSRAAFETDYDAVDMYGLHDTGGYYDDKSDIIITYKPYQQKSIYNQNPTTRSHIMYSRGGDTMSDYARQHGRHEQNEFGRKRNIVTAKRTSPTNRVSKSVQTLKQVPSLQQYRRVAIDNQVLWEGMGVYDPVTLENMREWGRDYIARAGGLRQAMLDLTRDLRSANFKNITQLISAANQVFYELGAEQPGLINSNDYNKFVAEYIATRSEWGRVGKAMQLVNDSPVGRRMYWERVVEKMNENNREAVSQGVDKLFHKNYKDIVVPQHMFQMLEQAKNEEEINKAEYAITQYIGEHSPLTVAEALRNWRYFAMLFNPVTHIRNLLGNVTMRGGVTVKDAIAAGMENAAVRMGMMDENERTHAIVLQQDDATKDYIEKLYQQNREMIQSGGRDGFYQQMMNAKKRSPIKAVDWLMRLNTDLQTKNPKWQKLADMISLEGEDAIFLRASFKKAAAQYIQAKGIDVNNITKEQRHDIVQYATQQAQEATYRDASKLADALNQFAKSGWVQRLAVEAVMPFKKTPINIAKRGFSYSPFGLARGLVDLARDAVAKSKGGELVVPASKVVDELAQGLTGTAVAMLGYFLAQAGIIRLSAGEGDKDDKFAQDTGHQSYSLEIGDLSIKIDQLAPMTFPLFMGAALDKWRTQGGDSFTMSDFTDALMSISDPLMDMSFMSSLNSVLETYDENQLKGVAVNALQSYASQYLPTLGAKLNNAVIDPTVRRTTKSSAASPLGSTWDYFVRSSLSKIPGGSYALEPYVKTTGEVDTTDSFGEWALNFLNNFVLPTNVKIMDTSNVNNEISRLVRQTGNTDYVPQNPPKYLTIDNQRVNMTAEQYTEYSKDYNETTYAALTAVMSAPAYKNMTDDQRIDALDKAYRSAKKAVQDKYKVIMATNAW